MTDTETTFKLKEGCGFYLDVFDKPKQIKNSELIPIATKVKYTHMAAVVRWRSEYKVWRLTEPKVNWYPRVHEDESEFDTFKPQPQLDFWATKPNDKINKDIVVWVPDYIGAAYVFGFVKRGIGQSVKGSSSPGSYYDPPEYEPGYFESEAYIPLYALKSGLQGVEYFFVPIHCVEVL